MSGMVKAIRVDDDGVLRCWKCGGTQFRQGRTTRSKVAVGVGALLTSKKMICLQCGSYNQPGSAKPYKPKGKTAHVQTPPAPAPAAPAGWHPDPTGRYPHRWWTGTAWTDTIHVNGQTLIDPQGEP